ncbi:killer cell lectin-like receptor subfamily B member 1B allele B [Ornithorhynchus anatinus]|uniref:C-type lectin domain-containing protein n=1 Tax=Ornithorhynchus anatinus TaxID=9258 RepID=A0A6I8P9K0_ORNAN|nr:killer cell lectin-like receptor subfamily B member 1B allele B [Ornithorhynchus anatinus]
MSRDIVYADIKLPGKNPSPSSLSAPSQTQDSLQSGQRIRAALKVACVVIVLLLGAVIALSILAVPRRRTCPVDWKMYRGQCYWFSKNNEKKTWNQSTAFCAEKKSNLPKIQNICDLGFLWSQIPPSTFFRIGLHILRPGANWTWLDGSALDWSLFQVKGSTGMNTCAVLSRDGIYSENCDAENPWICQQ